MPAPALPEYSRVGEVYASVAARLSRLGAGLDKAADRWMPNCVDGTNQANAKVHRRLMKKGYTPAQIATDPTVPALAHNLAVVFALLKGAQTNDYNTESIVKEIELLEEELEDYPVVDQTAALFPEAPDPSGGIAHGRMEAYDSVKFPWAG